MISVSGKHWEEEKFNKRLIEKIKLEYKFNDLISYQILSKKFNNEEIYSLKNDVDVSNPFFNKTDFKKAIKILDNSIINNENICIIGDYDVDGCISTSLLVKFLKKINARHFYYIPNRFTDGYGSTLKLIKKLCLKKPNLIIMVDNGSTSNDAIDYLNKNNIKSIIIDHHEINKPYPKSDTIINPKKDNNNKEASLLCATTLTYFFIDILINKTKSSFKLSDFLIYVLLATICDVMPLRKINKIIANNAMKNFKLKNNPAINFIFDQHHLKKKISVEDLGFLIGPIINAGGRLNHSNYGVELLSSNNLEIIKDRCIKLIKLNDMRKRIEQNILQEIDFEKIKNQNKNVIIYYKRNINEGLIGIIAARLKDYFNKPSIVITTSNSLLKASGRSTATYNIGKLIKSLVDSKIIEKGGGHNMAAGFTIKKNNIKLLDYFIQKDYSKKNSSKSNLVKYDIELSLSAINGKFINNLNKLGPFGNLNFLPTVLIKNVKIIKFSIINNKHISAIIKPEIGKSVKTICFNCLNTEIGDQLLNYKKKINIVAQIHENIWNNKKSVQLNIKDIIL